MLQATKKMGEVDTVFIDEIANPGHSKPKKAVKGN